MASEDELHATSAPQGLLWDAKVMPHTDYAYQDQEWATAFTPTRWIAERAKP